MAAVSETEPWEELLRSGREDERLVHDDTYGARPARTVSIPGNLDWRLIEALHKAGIEELYEHQLEALLQAFDGPTIITTGTASGKSLCFQLPTLDVLCSDRTARALYIYPTKALAQDQARALHRFGLQNAIRPAIYDGDTPR
ncbi:MAG TPA: DEAD/DEAH box helicase, partial [Solirubrobacteraceae bacterium]|nr:DEAD/DEAH box helicase [Solirubrobacteraceae bacterium]